MSRRHYSTVTNICLLVGVASAFGYDRSPHAGWLAAAGLAAVVAFATYLRRHWDRGAASQAPIVTEGRATPATTEAAKLLASAIRASEDDLASPPAAWAFRQGKYPPLVVIVDAKSPDSDPTQRSVRILQKRLLSRDRRVHGFPWFAEPVVATGVSFTQDLEVADRITIAMKPSPAPVSEAVH